MANKNESKTDWLEPLYELTKKIFFKTLSNMSFNKIKNIYKTKEKWFYIASIPFSFYLIFKLDSINPKVELPKWVYLYTLFGYLVYKAIYLIGIEHSYSVRFRGLAEMFKNKVKVMEVIKDKKTNDITYILHSYIAKNNIDKNTDEIAHYLNTNIISITQNKKNFKQIYIKTNKFLEDDTVNFNKNSIENKLISILKFYNFNPSFLKKYENEFLTFIKIKCQADIKKVLSKQNDIASKLKLAKEELNIRIELDYFIFEISKKDSKTYLLQNHIDIVDINKKYEIPVILGINQATGKMVVEDMTNLLHTLIGGTSGGGKSSFFNCLVQSIMYFGSDVTFIMADFKRVELSQYKNFKNTIFIKKQEVFLETLKKLDQEMENRYDLFESTGVKKIQSYNLKQKKKLPFIIVCIDEIADLRVNNNENLTEDIEDILTRLLNMGRAAGIIIICATQRPSAKQLNTELRDRLVTKISFQVTVKETQKMIGVYGTEKLKTGEFIIISEKYDNVRFKALFIDEDNGKNKVYDKLFETYGGRNDAINAREEKQQKVSLIKN
ncbi:MAG: FtsK/SpoIIIE domain-containing protein [Clostridiales bacterium]